MTNTNTPQPAQLASLGSLCSAPHNTRTSNVPAAYVTSASNNTRRTWLLASSTRGVLDQTRCHT